ncbi:MAG: hypothetical protein IJW92_06005 [Clostridia bacterium]|nr:hypothetical protein [Clostridia bacterium]
MNENQTVIENSDSEDATRSCADSQSAETGAGSADAAMEETVGDAIFENSGADPNPDSEPAVSKADEDELADLRTEIARLQEKLAGQSAVLSRIESEYEEFYKLYPEIPVATLPASIWEEVQTRGTSLAAAYALAERRRVCAQEMAMQRNEENRNRSAGALKAQEAEEFSPDEVRAMSATEVRANLPKIMRSMQKWR